MDHIPWSPAEEAKVWKVMSHKTGKISKADRKKLQRKLRRRSPASINSRINVIRVRHRIPTNLNDREVSKILGLRKSNRKAEANMTTPTTRSSKLEVRTTENVKNIFRAFLNKIIQESGATLDNPIIFKSFRTKDRTLLDNPGPTGVMRQNWERFCSDRGHGADISTITMYTLLKEQPGLILFLDGPSGDIAVPLEMRAQGFVERRATKASKTQKGASKAEVESLRLRMTATEATVKDLLDTVNGLARMVGTSLKVTPPLVELTVPASQPVPAPANANVKRRPFHTAQDSSTSQQMAFPAQVKPQG